MPLDPKLAKKVDRNMAAEQLIECTWNDKPAVAAFDADRLVIAGSGFGAEIAAPFASVTVLERAGNNRRVRCYGMEETITFFDGGAAASFDAALAKRLPAPENRAPSGPAIAADRVTTLQELPGHRIVRMIGAITELTATSGFTATVKGNTALDAAMMRLRREGAAKQANAIVGLTASAFGAAGGITSAFGGDAVGVLLMGTAVVVEPLAGESAPAGS